MNPKTITWVLAAIALSLAVVLAVVLIQRPGPENAAPGPTGLASSEPRSASPTVEATSKPTVTSEEGGPGPLPSSEVGAHDDASPGATPYSQTDEARRQWRPVATGFGRAFTATKGKKAAQWRASLAPFVTGKVRQQLTTVDLHNVPSGKFTGIEPAEYGEDKVAVFAHYDPDLTLVLYLILDGDKWSIYAYDRLVE